MNGQAILAGQLIKTKCELGVATIDIDRANSNHSGVYTLHIKNDVGEAAASISVKVLGGAAVEGQVQHEASWNRIQQLEAPKPRPLPEPEKIFGSPSILQGLISQHVNEGDPCHFECQV